jgi:hypothetical protein
LQGFSISKKNKEKYNIYIEKGANPAYPSYQPIETE